MIILPELENYKKMSHKSYRVHDFPHTKTLWKKSHEASNASLLFLFEIDEETMAGRGDAPWPTANGQEGRKQSSCNTWQLGKRGAEMWLVLTLTHLRIWNTRAWLCYSIGSTIVRRLCANAYVVLPCISNIRIGEVTSFYAFNSMWIKNVAFIICVLDGNEKEITGKKKY